MPGLIISARCDIPPAEEIYKQKTITEYHSGRKKKYLFLKKASMETVKL